jgi:hypothetical protein
MNIRHSLISTAVLSLVVAIGAGVSAMSAAQQEATPPRKTPPGSPPAAPTAPPGMEDMPMPPPPGEHHKWLQQLVGNWTVETEMTAEGMPPMKSTGTDTARSLGDGGRWVLCELKAEMPGMGPMSAMLTLGYNSETGKYQGTWVDSMHDHLWVYVGTLDATKKILTLEAEGPNMMDPAATAKVKYRDVIEIKSADHRTLTSSAYMDGKWVQFVTANYRRTK